MNIQTVGVILLAVAVAVGLCVLLTPLATSTGVFDTWKLQAEAANAQAQADRINAQAELTEEQAGLIVAQGERVLAEAQSEVMVDNEKTVNLLMKVWGIVGPAALVPVGFFVFLAGVVCGGAVMYAVGLSRALSVATQKPTTEEKNPQVPPPLSR